MTHHQPSIAERDRRRRNFRTVLGLLGVALLAAILGGASGIWVSHSPQKESSPAWKAQPSPQPSQFAQLEDLLRKVTDLDYEVNELDAAADKSPHDDKPVNDLDAAQKECVKLAERYRRVAAGIPATDLSEAGIPAKIGGSDSATDCLVDESDGATPRPAPAATNG